jgi:cation/acetate symporter
MVDVLNHDSAIIGLTNPALISMPLAFVSGILVSLLRPEPEAAARFAEAERRIHLGDAAAPPRPASGLPARAR